MQNAFFVNIKKVLSVSMQESHSPAIEKSPSTNIIVEIQHLTIKDYSAVAGGPQISNNPPN